MHHLSYWLSIAAVWLYRLSCPQVTVMTIQAEPIVRLDPRGLVRNDLAVIEKHVEQVHWKKGEELTAVIYRQAQADLINVINRHIIARRI